MPVEPGDVVVQGEDLGQWVKAQRFGWDTLAPGQQWLLESILELEPASEREKVRALGRTSQADKWKINLAAAAQFYQREGHLTVPRKHVETISVDERGLPALPHTENVTERRSDRAAGRDRDEVGRMMPCEPSEPLPVRRAVDGQLYPPPCAHPTHLHRRTARAPSRAKTVKGGAAVP